MTLTPYFISEKSDEEMPCEEKIAGLSHLQGRAVLFYSRFRATSVPRHPPKVS